MLNITEVYKTSKEHERGLQFHKPLLANNAVAFQFSSPKTSSFWNKNVSFPIDVAFFDESKYLINIEQLSAGQVLDVTSSRPYKYVIETRKGWFAEHNIKEGDSMDSLVTLGFTKIAVYDPTVEENTQESKPLFKQVNSLPTTTAINQLANQWMYRKPAKESHLKTKRFVQDYNEVK
jgi:uncharacterized membrane protein (UPF0127 family)